MFFDKDAETMARSELEKIQLEKLKEGFTSFLYLNTMKTGVRTL